MPEVTYKLHRRFDRMARLLGEDPMHTLGQSRVCIIGLGGVGSFACEALARSGIGYLKLVDFDRVCATNTNRQIHALHEHIGKYKAHILADRVRAINPQCQVEPVTLFYNERNASAILDSPFDYVVDAIDNLTAKCHLLANLKEKNIPVVSSTGASGRMDPTAIRIADLAHTQVDPFAEATRKTLRRKYGFPSKRGAFGIQAVYSLEHPISPKSLNYDQHGFNCVCPGGKNEHHSCEERHIIYGTASFVTGAFGLACASVVIQTLSGQKPGILGQERTVLIPNRATHCS